MRDRLESEYLRIEPDAIRGEAVGTHRVWRTTIDTPAHHFDSVLAIAANGHAFEIIARSGFDPSLVPVLVTLAAALPRDWANSHSLLVRHGVSHPNHSFDTAAIIPPAIAQRFAHQSELLNSRTSWIVPAYSCEFRTGHEAAAFNFAIRSNHVEPLDWSRQPTPIIRAHLLSPWPGGMLRYRKQPAFLPYSSLDYVLPALPSTIQGFRILSSWDSELTLRRESTDGFLLTVSQSSGPRQERHVSPEDIVRTVQSILLAEGRGGGA